MIMTEHQLLEELQERKVIQVLKIRKRQEPPNRTWKYIDAAGNIQGPYSTLQMLEWWEKGYLRSNLMLNCDGMDGVCPLRALYPIPATAFVSTPQSANLDICVQMQPSDL
eukprot:gnl/MRDRNA2_/MRDRNA2_129141_c0_seq1.p3 gnl/MRDRNA2_/MRDRNA2_129141_c0~~gnl/MRDRNA2_/MRDRNA2_129141_c0_seq1.p3  ORF type:complete len:110 (-),score=19.92 gnl/MRDRNA2_/MRDRNA2_129141_c0_seq1:41-370(-)